MNPFIVTLGMLSIVRGAALVISDAQTVTGMPPAVQTAGTDLLGPVPVPAVIVLVLGAARRGSLLARTQWGRWIYAVGGDPEAARRVGIPVDRVLLSVYVAVRPARRRRRRSSSRAARTPARRPPASCSSWTPSPP